MLAEITDKMPGALTIWAIGLGAAATVWLLSRASRRSLIISIPLAGLLLAGFYREFVIDKSFGSTVVSEMGWSYFYQAFAASVLPVVCALVCAIPVLRSMRSFAAKAS
jgi:hypothetical protein